MMVSQSNEWRLKTIFLIGIEFSSGSGRGPGCGFACFPIAVGYDPSTQLKLAGGFEMSRTFSIFNTL